MGVGFFGKLFSKGSKVSPDIKSVKPNLTKTVKQTKSDEYSKRIRALSGAQTKLQTGKQMMKEAQKERKKLVDTGRAFQFKHSKSFHALAPGDKDKFKDRIKIEKTKKFKKGKELAAGGRVGLKTGTNPFKKKTNVDKIKETFGPKKRINAKSGFPDLSGDGKTTFKDVLIGRGVIKKKNGKTKKKVI
jgi:Ulp1 family protease